MFNYIDLRWQGSSKSPQTLGWSAGVEGVNYDFLENTNLSYLTLSGTGSMIVTGSALVYSYSAISI